MANAGIGVEGGEDAVRHDRLSGLRGRAEGRGGGGKETK